MGESFLTMFANAKINLALAINGVREDGFHDLQSVMQSIELHDIVKVRRYGEKVVCRCGRLSGSGNLAYKAAMEFLEQAKLSGGIEIEIEKHIPIQAGLAGGSADAAATLCLLNRLYDEPFSTDELLKLAGICGADVAFCLQGGTMWATGRGERLEPLPKAPRIDLVLIKPDLGVNTGEAYRQFDLLGQSGQLSKADWEQALVEKSLEKIRELLYNDLEPASIQLVPIIQEYKKILLDLGCSGALMSGSGSSVFGIAQGENHARQVASELRKRGFKHVWVTNTI